jgi:hypothetical protein
MSMGGWLAGLLRDPSDKVLQAIERELGSLIHHRLQNKTDVDLDNQYIAKSALRTLTAPVLHNKTDN